MNKGEMMKLIYTTDELKSIDPSLPYGWEDSIEYRKLRRGAKSYWLVMNYNENVLGSLEDMRLIALNRNIKIEEK